MRKFVRKSPRKATIVVISVAASESDANVTCADVRK